MLLFKCFRFSEVMDQMFLTVRGAVKGTFKATLVVASAFVQVVLRPGWGGWRCPPPPPPTHTHTSGFFFFFGVDLILDYIYISGGIFDL